MADHREHRRFHDYVDGRDPQPTPVWSDLEASENRQQVTLSGSGWPNDPRRLRDRLLDVVGTNLMVGAAALALLCIGVWLVDLVAR